MTCPICHLDLPILKCVVCGFKGCTACKEHGGVIYECSNNNCKKNICNKHSYFGCCNKSCLDKSMEQK